MALSPDFSEELRGLGDLDAVTVGDLVGVVVVIIFDVGDLVGESLGDLTGLLSLGDEAGSIGSTVFPVGTSVVAGKSVVAGESVVVVAVVDSSISLFSILSLRTSGVIFGGWSVLGASLPSLSFPLEAALLSLEAALFFLLVDSSVLLFLDSELRDSRR